MAIDAQARSELLERDRELGVLEELIQGTLEGRRGLALVEGPAGIGKSRLLAATREAARGAGFRVLAARGSDLERELPFGVVRQLFDPLLVDPADRARWMTGSAQPAARVFEPPDDGAAESDVSFGVLYGLFWVTANIAADGPLLLLLDDLHWCDPASLRFVAYLERRLEGLNVVVVAAARTSERAVRLAAARRDRRRSRGRLGASARAERGGRDRARAWAVGSRCRAAVLRRVPSVDRRQSAARAGAAQDAAGGERAARPGSRRRDPRSRVRARCHAPCCCVWRGCRPTSSRWRAPSRCWATAPGLPAVATVAQTDEQRVAAAARALAGAEILRAEPPLGFVHPLVRDAVYHDLAAAERELLHERAAKALWTSAPRPSWSRRSCSPRRRAPSRGSSTLLREAALAARRRGATESAVRYLRRALEEPPPAEQREQLLLELGLVEGFVNPPAAVAHISQVHDQLVDPQVRAQAAAMLGRMLLFTGPPQAAATVVQGALADLPAERAGTRQALEALELYTVAFGAQVPDAAERLARVRAAGLQKGVGGSMLSAVAAWDWALRGGTAQECSELALALLADGWLIALDAGFMALVAARVLVVADRDEARDRVRIGAERGPSDGLADRGLERERVARLGLARARRARRGRGRAPRGARGDPPDGGAERRGHGVRGRLPRPRPDRARRPRRSTSRAHELPAADPRLGRRGGGAPHHGRAAARRGRPDARACRSRPPSRTAGRRGERRLGPVAVADGPGARRARAARRSRALLEEELVKARHWGAPGSLARTLRLLGTIRKEDGLDLLHEAVDTADGSPARLEHAKALDRARVGVAARTKAVGRAGAAAGRVRDRQPLRRGAAGRACPERALRRGWPPAAPGTRPAQTR